MTDGLLSFPPFDRASSAPENDAAQARHVRHQSAVYSPNYKGRKPKGPEFHRRGSVSDRSGPQLGRPRTQSWCDSRLHPVATERPAAPCNTSQYLIDYGPVEPMAVDDDGGVQGECECPEYTYSSIETLIKNTPPPFTQPKPIHEPPMFSLTGSGSGGHPSHTAYKHESTADTRMKGRVLTVDIDAEAAPEQYEYRHPRSAPSTVHHNSMHVFQLSAGQAPAPAPFAKQPSASDVDSLLPPLSPAPPTALSTTHVTPRLARELSSLAHLSPKFSAVRSPAHAQHQSPQKSADFSAMQSFSLGAGATTYASEDTEMF